MPTLPSPGVYVFEQPPSARPIAGVGTSTAGFLGLVGAVVDRDGNTITLPPQKVPVLITNWGEFKEKFGDVQALNETLAHAVYGFFNNGGTRCWVMHIEEDPPSFGTPPTDTDALNPKALFDEQFGTIDEIALVAYPGAFSDVQHAALIDHCAKMKDRFAILDGVPRVDDSGTMVRPKDDEIAPAKSKDGTFAAAYFPWIKVFNPLTPATPAVVPPSGHLAGIYARSDSTRGVHKAPGNEGVRGALDTEWPIDSAKQEGLHDNLVNAIRNFRGAVKVWGVRTLSEDTSTQHISTRRFLNFLSESIEDGTQFVVFEPNSPALWEQIKRTVNGFLFTQWSAGALFGNKPEEAFYVKCDEETNPPELREAGQVVIEIGVAIVKPAEFVVFNIQQILQTG